MVGGGGGGNGSISGGGSFSNANCCRRCDTGFVMDLFMIVLGMPALAQIK